MNSYKEDARAARVKVLEMVYRAKSSHIGSNFSVIDILTVLFANLKKDDQVILSAGWKAAAFYYFLSRGGYFPADWLDTYNQEGSTLIGLTEPGVPGVLFAGGSMQMGLPAAVGFALAKKLKGESGRVYCVMSDGELAGGMVWEACQIAKKHKLDNLTVLVDNNKLQAMGKTFHIMPAQWPGIGWKKLIVGGHNHEALEKVLALKTASPTVICCGTIKGYGVSFMRHNNLYHYKDLSQEEYERARAELLS